MNVESNVDFLGDVEEPTFLKKASHDNISTHRKVHQNLYNNKGAREIDLSKHKNDLI